MTTKIKKIKVNKKRFWLFLHPYVYVSVKKNNAIIYNTLNGSLLEFDADEPQIVSMIKKLNADSHLYVVKIKEDEIDAQLDRFIRLLRNSFSGDLIDTSIRTFRPIQMKPILSLYRKLEYLTEAGKKNKIMVKDQPKDYLSTISFYINGSCNQACRMCATAYNQFLCCHKNEKSKSELNLKDFSSLMDEISGSKINKLNILGGNIFLHSNLITLVHKFNTLSIIKEYYINYLNITPYPKFFNLLRQNYEKSRLTIIINFPINEALLARNIDILVKEGFHDIKYCFVIENETDIADAEKIAAIHKIANLDFYPHYNGCNYDFFKNVLFFNKEAIIESRPGMKDLFSRMTINTLEFKRLTILNNKNIFANLNNPKIGKLGENDIYEIIHKELHKGKSWTKVRQNVTPCKSCTYNALCPPISNYEYFIGKYNICNIK